MALRKATPGVRSLSEDSPQFPGFVQDFVCFLVFSVKPVVVLVKESIRNKGKKESPLCLLSSYHIIVVRGTL
jgi:hypothetical protein